MRQIDFTKFSEKGTDSSNPGHINKEWWKTDKETIHEDVMKVVLFLGQNDSRRQTQYQLSTRLYGNSNMFGVNGVSYQKIASIQNANKDRVTYNVVQSSIDTVTSKMAKNKPKPMFLTSGGDYRLQRKAKKLDKFVDGIFYENGMHELGVECFRDGGVLGDGLIHVYNLHDRVKFERTIASELYTDWVDAFYGHPTQLHRVKNMDRSILMDQFPEHEELIHSATSMSDMLIGSHENIADQITVVESWHLPSGPDAKDGVHCININEGNLFYEEWKRDHFPFAKLPCTPRMYGYWAQSWAEQLQNIQLEINKLLWVIQRSMHLGGSFKILMENGSKIVKEYFNNDIGTVITYANTKPEYITPPMVQLEVYTHLQTLKAMAFEQVGVSMLSAAAKKPEGLDSGKALREFNDIESDRFMVTGQRYEQFHLDVAKLAIEEAKSIYSKKKSYEVKVPQKKFIETIDWKDIDLTEDEYTMKMFPVSSLPQDPSGRLQTIQEYVQAGWLSPRQARRLADFPDLEQIESLQNSTEDYLHMILEKIVEDGEYTPPEPYDDIDLAIELGLEYYAQGKTNNLEDEKLEMLRMFLDQVQALKAKMMAPPPGMPAPGMEGMPPTDGMGAPQAVPQAPPSNDLIPNIPAGAA